MSKPIRYTQNIKCVEPSSHAQNICSGMVECSIGEWVLHSDYESLKAEVKRLEQESAKWRRAEHAVGDKCIEFAKTIQTLKAEVERLKNNVAYLDKKLDEELDGGQS